MKQLCVGRYGGRQAVNGVHIVHPKFPFLTEFISLCFYCLTEMLGYNSSHLCLRYRCQWLSYPIPVRPNESIINAVSGRDFSDQRQAGIITQTALAIPDGSVHSLWGGVQPGLLGCAPALLTAIMSQIHFPHTHTTCAIRPSQNGDESCIQKIIHIHSSILTDSEQCSNPVPNLNWIQRAQTYTVWPTKFGVTMHKEVTLGSKVAVNYNICPTMCSSSVAPFNKHRII